MQYAVRHITEFHYVEPVRESVMEVRLQPRTDAHQTCYTFELGVQPSARVNEYEDSLGNVVHYFDIPARHEALRLESRALVDVVKRESPPDTLSPDAWQQLDATVDDGDFWEMLLPSRFARSTEILEEVTRQMNMTRRDDPMTVLRELNYRIYSDFSYEPLTTHANSPIDDALTNRAGVCQDFAHIFIAIARKLRVPCRYVSGYLFHRSEDHDRSAQDSSHAWAEAFLPDLDWIGFDPTNNLVAGERHITVALGRDYADVPPTRGVFKGVGASELRVGVQVTPARQAPPPDSDLKLERMAQNLTAEEREAIVRMHANKSTRDQQQQQQQQQQQ